MSAIAAVLGETMFYLDTGERSRIEKVKMVQDSFLYGFTGRNDSAVEFFGGLIDDNLDPTEHMDNLSYIQLIDILDRRFDLYEHGGVSENFDTCAIICGPVKGHMQCVRYLIRSEEYEKKIIDGSWKLEFVGSFLEKHFENFELNKNAEDIVMAIVDAFQIMVDKGMVFDESINNDVVAYFINKGFDRPYITERLK